MRALLNESCNNMIHAHNISRQIGHTIHPSVCSITKLKTRSIVVYHPGLILRAPSTHSFPLLLVLVLACYCLVEVLHEEAMRVRFAPNPIKAAGPSKIKNAVIIIDFQNEFVRQEGKLHQDVKEMMVQTEMLQKVPHVVNVARENGALIIHSPVIMKDGEKFKDEDWDPHAYGSMENLFVEGTWNCDFADEVKPSESDVILKNRVNFSAFRGTNLKDVLEDCGITSLFVMGFLSNVCVEETTIEAKELFPDMKIYVCSDGCAAKSKKEHYVAMGNTLPIYADIITCSTAQNLLSTSTPSGMLRAEEANDDSQTIALRPEVEFTYRPRILALHGAQSNSAVTELQLANLRITEEDYDIEYLHGGVEVDEAHPDLDGLFTGPFYSWFDKNDPTSIVRAVHDVVKFCQTRGPFDGIYGFSSGAVVASLVANLSSDLELQNLLLDRPEQMRVHVQDVANLLNVGSSFRDTAMQQQRSQRSQALFGKRQSVRLFARTQSHRFGPGRKQSQRFGQGRRLSQALFGPGPGRRQSLFRSRSRRNIFTGPPPAEAEIISLEEPLIKFVILVCSAPDISSVREEADKMNPTQIEAGTIRVSSFHVIGIEDAFKAKSEKNASFYATREVRYMPGGHGVPRDVGLDNDLCDALRNFSRKLGRPARRGRVQKYIQMNEVSGVQLLGESQVAVVKLNHELLPGCKFMGGATIRGALGAQPSNKPFLYTSRNKNSDDVTTYGDLLNFINGGAGDIRALGVAPEEVVAYVAPPGGSAMSAVAFLSIGAQTAAAPLAPNTAEPDALDALNQFGAKHLILFDGVECPGVETAFEKYAAEGNATLHRASAIGGEKPGLFEYAVTVNVTPASKEPLMNSEDGTCLLLRTSGTTARPKGVPLSQGDLITNGAIIASAMQLTESDVCYSIMPLFHIGGISASILCTLTSGGAVSCDPEPFDPSRMVEALALSRPQPTWYSSVPTIHNATVNFLKNIASTDENFNSLGIGTDGVWAKGHSLRMIRSGAAALLGPDGEALAAAYGGVPIYPTYSMSEQMPISQPPAGNDDSFFTKPGAVGVPVAASTAIVSRGNLRPQPPGVEGEIAISGPTVLKNYLDNPEADKKSFFLLSLAEADSTLPYFLTGDIGVIDSDGFLSLKGRAKELIKKGGEQVSPFEVEDPLKTHPWVQTPVCFAVPSDMYGEEVGCALVLSASCPIDKDDAASLKKVSAEMRAWLKEAKLAPIKWPTKWILVDDDELPKTKTKKYIRVNLSTHLGMIPAKVDKGVSKVTTKTKVDWEVIGAFRFILACYVMFMHIGSNKSWGAFNNLRGWPWHVHVFFTLGGYSMASPMNPTIQKKFSYFWSRIGSMYPMYAVALTFGLINLLIVCRPSTFRSEFHWDAQPNDLFLDDGSPAPLFCEGTPATKTSYWGSLVLTIFTYAFGLAITPFWPMTWWLGYYLWFSSMYYCCLACFPITYNYFYEKTRKKKKLLTTWLFGLLAANAIICTGAWFIWKDMEGYGHYGEDGKLVARDEYTDGVAQNVGVLSFYLFGPFWQIYFVIGMAAAFLYDAYRPAEKHGAYKWGWVADLISLMMIGMSVGLILQGYKSYEEMPMRPDAANEIMDSANSNRLWDNIGGRIFAPLTTLWIYALSTGEGFTAKILRWPFLAQTLAPNSYNCFLFHQMVGQWYYAATRNGTVWNWWRYRKDFYWFSPAPCPVEWYEYFYIVGLVVAFSRLMDALEPIVSEVLSFIKGIVITPEESDDEDTAELLIGLIEGMTGIEPLLDYTLEECGLASIGVPILVNLLNKNFSTKQRRLNVTASDLVGAKTIGDMIDVVDAAKALADDQGV